MVHTTRTGCALLLAVLAMLALTASRTVAFPASVFSPERPALRVRCLQPSRAAKKLVKVSGTPPECGGGITRLSDDNLACVMMQLWKTCPAAPMCAAVSKRFHKASADASQQLMRVDVAPPRLSTGSAPPLTPTVSEQAGQTIDSWGPKLKTYDAKRTYHAVDKDDMGRVLDVKGGGWLTNFSMDAYMHKLMPSVADAQPGAPNVFLPGNVSHSIEQRGSLGIAVWSGDDPHEDLLLMEEQTAALRAKWSAALTGAEAVYAQYNVKNVHWALLRMRPQRAWCEVLDSTGHIGAAHARKLMAAFTEVTGVETAHWSVRVYEHAASGVAQQRDGKSCGIFACVAAAHLVANAKMPDIQADVKAWRRHVASRIIE